MNATFTLTRDLTAEEYAAIVRFGASAGATFTLVERLEQRLSSDGQRILDRLAAYAVSRATVAEWPGTRLHGTQAILRRYTLVDESARVLLSAPGLYAWVQPECPEDLTLWAGGEPWLVTIAHERDAYVRLSEARRQELLRRVPTLHDALRAESSERDAGR